MPKHRLCLVRVDEIYERQSKSRLTRYRRSRPRDLPITVPLDCQRSIHTLTLTHIQTSGSTKLHATVQLRFPSPACDAALLSYLFTFIEIDIFTDIVQQGLYFRISCIRRKIHSLATHSYTQLSFPLL